MRCWFHDCGADIERKLDRVIKTLDLVLTNMEKIMSTVDDLNASVGDLLTAVTTGNAQIESELQTILGGNDAAAVEQAVANIRAITQSVNDEVAKAQSALNPQPKSA